MRSFIARSLQFVAPKLEGSSFCDSEYPYPSDSVHVHEVLGSSSSLQETKNEENANKATAEIKKHFFIIKNINS